MKGYNSYRVTWEDLTQAIDEHQAEHQLTVLIQVSVPCAAPASTYGELVVRRGLRQPAGAELSRIRVPLNPRRPEGWCGVLLYALVQAVEEATRDPWQWPLEKVRAVTGGE